MLTYAPIYPFALFVNAVTLDIDEVLRNSAQRDPIRFPLTSTTKHIFGAKIMGVYGCILIHKQSFSSLDGSGSSPALPVLDARDAGSPSFPPPPNLRGRVIKRVSNSSSVENPNLVPLHADRIKRNGDMKSPDAEGHVTSPSFPKRSQRHLPNGRDKVDQYPAQIKRHQLRQGTMRNDKSACVLISHDADETRPYGAGRKVVIATSPTMETDPQPPQPWNRNGPIYGKRFRFDEKRETFYNDDQYAGNGRPRYYLLKCNNPMRALEKVKTYLEPVTYIVYLMYIV